MERRSASRQGSVGGQEGLVALRRGARRTPVPPIGDFSGSNYESEAIELGDSDEEVPRTSAGAALTPSLRGTSMGERHAPIEIIDDSGIFEHGAGSDLFSPSPRRASPATPILIQRRTSRSAPQRSGPSLQIGSTTRAIAAEAQVTSGNPSPQRPPPTDEGAALLSTFDCPICMCSPTDIVCTPCGHVFCGECLFSSLKTNRTAGGPMSSYQLDEEIRASLSGGRGGRGRRGRSTRGRGRGRGGASGTGENIDPLSGRCPVCRALIPGGFDLDATRGHPTTLPKIVGLKLKLGTPSDDPRRPLSSRPQSGAPQRAADTKGKRRRDSSQTNVDVIDVSDSSPSPPLLQPASALPPVTSRGSALVASGRSILPPSVTESEASDEASQSMTDTDGSDIG